MSHVDLDQACQKAIQASNDLLTGLRAAGVVVVEVGKMMAETSESFARFLFKHPADFQNKVQALEWSCQSAVGLVKGMVVEHPLNNKEAQESRKQQVTNLGQWAKFADDMVKGAEGRLELWKELEQALIERQAVSKP